MKTNQQKMMRLERKKRYRKKENEQHCVSTLTGYSMSKPVCIIQTHINIYIYISIPKQTVSLHHSSSVWLDTRVAPIRNRNPPNFTSGWWHNSMPTWNSTSTHEFHLFTSDSEMLNSWEELCITRVATVIFLQQSVQPSLEGSVYIVTQRQNVSLNHYS